MGHNRKRDRSSNRARKARAESQGIKITPPEIKPKVETVVINKYDVKIKTWRDNLEKCHYSYAELQKFSSSFTT